MKFLKNIKALAIVSVVMALASLAVLTYTPQVQAADTARADGNPIYAVAYHTAGGATNTTTGYTNALVYRQVKGSLLTLDLEFGGSTVNVSNNITVVVFPAWNTQTNAAAAAARITLLPATTYTRVTTNISNFGAPYAAFQIENPSSNVGTLTNVVFNYTSKIP